MKYLLITLFLLPTMAFTMETNSKSCVLTSTLMWDRPETLKVKLYCSGKEEAELEIKYPENQSQDLPEQIAFVQRTESVMLTNCAMNVNSRAGQHFCYFSGK